MMRHVMNLLTYLGCNDCVKRFETLNSMCMSQVHSMRSKGELIFILMKQNHCIYCMPVHAGAKKGKIQHFLLTQE